MGIRKRNFNIIGVHWKIELLGGSRKNNIYRGESPKKGGLGEFTDLRGGLAKKRGIVFLRGLGTPMHTMGKVGGWGNLVIGGWFWNGWGWYSFMDYGPI